MNSVYFDFNDILADEQRIKVKLLCALSWAGLSGSTDKSDEIIDKNSVMDLPLWLATSLIKTPFAEKIMPKAFNSRVRSDLNANTANVPLKDVASHFYGMGHKLISTFSDQRISDLLYETFMGRLPLLTRPLQCTSDIAGISSLDAHTVDTIGFCPPSKMDALESHIFLMSTASRKGYDTWLRRDILKIKCNEE